MLLLRTRHTVTDSFVSIVKYTGNSKAIDTTAGRRKLDHQYPNLPVLLSLSVMNTVAEPEVGSTLPKEGVCRVILNCSVASMMLSSVIATVRISEVEPGLKVKFLTPALKSPWEESKESTSL
jgi:hypothetical protein